MHMYCGGFCEHGLAGNKAFIQILSTLCLSLSVIDIWYAIIHNNVLMMEIDTEKSLFRSISISK